MPCDIGRHSLQRSTRRLLELDECRHVRSKLMLKHLHFDRIRLDEIEELPDVNRRFRYGIVHRVDHIDLIRECGRC